MAKKPRERTARRSSLDIPIPPPEDAAPGAPGAEDAPQLENGHAADPRDRADLKSFTVYTDASGRIAWDVVKGKKRERLRSILNDPALASNIGLHVPANAAPMFDAPACDLLYQTLSTVLVGIARMRGVPPEACGIMAFTDAERGALVEPTTKVLAKYVGPMKYQDEIMLIVALATVMAGKAATMRDVLAQIDARRSPPTLPLAFEPTAGGAQG